MAAGQQEAASLVGARACDQASPAALQRLASQQSLEAAPGEESDAVGALEKLLKRVSDKKRAATKMSIAKAASRAERSAVAKQAAQQEAAARPTETIDAPQAAAATTPTKGATGKSAAVSAVLPTKGKGSRNAGLDLSS